MYIKHNALLSELLLLPEHVLMHVQMFRHDYVRSFTERRRCAGVYVRLCGLCMTEAY